MAAQVAAGSIANTQALDEADIVQATLVEVLECLSVARKLGLIESYRLLQEFGLGVEDGGEFLSEVGDGLRKGKIKIQLGKANEVVAPSATVAEKEILRRVDIERGTGFRMQGAESDELLLRTHRVQAPVVPPQVVEQWNLPFQFFRFLPHRLFLAPRPQ